MGLRVAGWRCMGKQRNQQAKAVLVGKKKKEGQGCCPQEDGSRRVEGEQEHVEGWFGPVHARTNRAWGQQA